MGNKYAPSGSCCVYLLPKEFEFAQTKAAYTFKNFR